MNKEQELLDQIDALLAINAKGNATPRIPGLAVELLTRSAEALRHLSSDEQAKVVVDGVAWAKVRVDTEPENGWCFATPPNHPDDVKRGLLPEWNERDQFFACVVTSPPAVAAGGVTEERIEAAARALAARAFARVSTSDKADQIVDKGWIIYADDACAALTAALAVGNKK